MAYRPKSINKEQLILRAEIKRDNVEYTDLEEECSKVVKEMGDVSFLKPILEYEYKIRRKRDYKFLREAILKYQSRKSIIYSYEDTKNMEISNIKPRRKILPTYIDHEVSFPAIGEKSIPMKRFGIWKDMIPPIGERIKANYSQFVLKNENSLTLDYFSLPVIENKLHTDPEGVLALVKIDFSRSEEEILKYISSIKKSFDSDPSTIQNLPEYLEIKKKHSAKSDLTLNLKNQRASAIIRHVNTLFVYDSKKLGLTEEYIISEIDRYQKEIKHLHDESFSDATLTNYFKIAKKLIE